MKDLEAMGDAVKPQVQVTVKIVNDGGLLPADTTAIDSNRIEVKLRRWFVKMSSVGELLAMLAHELGVHTLADLEMSPEDKNKERRDLEDDQTVMIGDQEFTSRYWAFPESRVEENGGRQRDHVAVGRDTGGPGGESARTRAYAATFLRIGDAIENDPKRQDAEKAGDQQVLLRDFLFDMGRIMALDDALPWRVFPHEGDVALVMNEYREWVLQRYAESHPWLERPELSRPFTKWGLRRTLAGRFSRYLKSRVSP